MHDVDGTGGGIEEGIDTSDAVGIDVLLEEESGAVRILELKMVAIALVENVL